MAELWLENGVGGGAEPITAALVEWGRITSIPGPLAAGELLDRLGVTPRPA